MTGQPREHDQRDGERFLILGELRGEVMVFQPTAVRQISRGGAQIETAFPLQVDALHEFRLTLGDRSFVVKCRVVHCQLVDLDPKAVQYHSGVEFIERSEHLNAMVSELIGALREGRLIIGASSP